MKRIPPHSKYVEPYVGGGSLFWAKEPSEQEVISDTDPAIVAVYRFLKSGSDADFAWMRDQPWEHSERRFYQLRDSNPSSVREQAYRAKYLAMYSHRGTGERTTAAEAENAGDNPGRLFLSNLEKYRDRLRNVTVLERDALAVMRAHDGPDTFFYLDPPWKKVHPGESWKEFDAQAFEKTVAGLKGKALVSYQGGLKLPGYHQTTMTRRSPGFGYVTKQTLYWNYRLPGRQATKGWDERMAAALSTA